MKQAHTRFQVSTSGKGLYDFTQTVERWVSEQGVANGLLTVFVQHTSCSLVIQENADPDVTADLRDYFERLVPANVEQYRHTAEGPDDMTSHIRTTLTGVSTGVPVIGGRMTLGTWQGLYLFEHRDAPHRRNVVLHLIGD
jgi:secondary thiamine-phosphate synthase enzyme